MRRRAFLASLSAGVLAGLAGLPGCAPRRRDAGEPLAPIGNLSSPRGGGAGGGAGGGGGAIVVAGQRFEIGAPVVLWSDRGGYNAYRTQPHFARNAAGVSASGRPRYDIRFARSGGLSAQELAQLRVGSGGSGGGGGGGGGGWTLPMLRRRVDQFVLHYDACGLSALCFEVLHDQRNLSVHFLLDLDGTIYQTLDVQERAWHATKANDRSVGVEIANIGAYAPGEGDLFDRWYARDRSARAPAGGARDDDSAGTRLLIPPNLEARYGPRGGLRRATPWPLRPARPQPATGTIHGRTLRQYDLTQQQYDSLSRLAAGLHRALPAIRLDYPREASGGSGSSGGSGGGRGGGGDGVLRTKMDDAAWSRFGGILAHWHVQADKIDPGPALDWQRVIEAARRLAR